MRQAQFDALAQLMRLRKTSARYYAAQMVLVHGKSAAEATETLATSRQNVDQAVAEIFIFSIIFKSTFVIFIKNTILLF